MYGNINVVTSTNYGMPIRDRERPSESVVSVIPEKIGRRGINSPILSYFGKQELMNSSFDRFKPHEYDLYEYSRLIDTEAIAYKAFERKKSLIFKNGYEISSLNDENAEYIRQRLREFKYVSGVSFESFLEELVYNLIVFHNAYCLFYRNQDKTTADTRTANGKEIQPLAAIFNFPTESIERDIASNGDILKYRQRIDYNSYKIFQAKDVKHLTYNKRSGFTMGTPPLEPVKDDILALRRIEESVETLIYKSLFPIIHVKVGSNDNPAKMLRNGQSEVSLMTNVLQEIDDYGGVVTSERVEIKAIGAESMALRVESYLKHFLERVMIGLGVSSTDLGVGDSSGKATGEVISQTLKEAVTDMQRVIARFITEELFTELLVESGKYDAKYLIPEEDIVYLSFNSLDRDAQIKIESHYLNLANSGMITQKEFREKIGLRDLSEEEVSSIGKWAESLLPPVEVEQMKAAIKASEISATTAQASTTSSTTSNKSSGAAATAKSITKPSNQYTDSALNHILDNILINRDNYHNVYSLISMHIESMLDIDNIYKYNTLQDICMSFADSVHSYSGSDPKSFIEDKIVSLYMEALTNGI